jgi:hypothetical protein
MIVRPVAIATTAAVIVVRGAAAVAAVSADGVNSQG